MIPADTVLHQLCSPADVVDDAHKHQCPQCSTTWAHTDHLNAMGATSEEYTHAHTCPTCGHEQYMKIVDEAELEKRRLAVRDDEINSLLAYLFGGRGR